MASTLGADLRAIVERTKQDVGKIVRNTALELQKGMVKTAPRDTGRLQANFQVGLNSINPDVRSAPSSDAVERARGALSKWRADQTIYLTNSLPYAHVAEYGLYGKPPGSANGPKTVAGYSTQAPSGFVRLTVQDFSQKLHEQVMRLK